MISFSIQNFGCRVNQAEAFSWAEEFQSRGLRLEEDFSRSDLVLVNTCTLTANADRDVRKFIRRIAQINPRARVVVAGCSVERARGEFEANPRIWRIFANREKGRLAEEVLALAGDAGRPEAPSFRSRAFLKVQDGCNCRCAFCIIPGVRGPSASVPRNEVLKRIRRYVDLGFREIVLAGIHLSSWGLDFEPKSSLLDLLRNIVKIEGLGWIRLSSLDPRFIDEEFIEFASESPGICPHFHLSLQSGSDRVLRLMGRKSTADGYGRILSALRRYAPDAALGADILTGFPEETDRDFEDTVGFLESSPLDYLHVFSYSIRPGTEAAGRPQLDVRVKKERSARLRKISREKTAAFRRRFAGRELDGIVIERKGGRTEVLTSNYIPVVVRECGTDPGGEARVKITGVSATGAVGDLANVESGDAAAASMSYDLGKKRRTDAGETAMFGAADDRFHESCRAALTADEDDKGKTS